MKKQFIRFKNIPDNEISAIYGGDLGIVGYEIGVCCYEFILQNDCYQIILPSFDISVTTDLQWFISDLEDGKIPVYLIEAEQVGVGTYNEPCVKNIDVISELELVELMYPIRKTRFEKSNRQLKIKQ